jgi:hypothetical protein
MEVNYGGELFQVSPQGVAIPCAPQAEARMVGHTSNLRRGTHDISPSKSHQIPWQLLRARQSGNTAETSSESQDLIAYSERVSKPEAVNGWDAGTLGKYISSRKRLERNGPSRDPTAAR